MTALEERTSTGPPELPDAGHAGDHDGHTGSTNAKLGMWLFLSSDCLFFGAFISTFLLYRDRPGQTGPSPSDLFNIPFTSVTSFILLMSSLTMVLALAAIQRGDMRRFRIWMLATVFFGVTFIGGQIFEFTEFTRQGLNIDTSLFGSSFFVLTGLHGAHVTGGIIWLLSLWGLSMQEHMGQGDAERVEIAGLYWHFVDVVWIVIFTVVYLVPNFDGSRTLSSEGTAEGTVATTGATTGEPTTDLEVFEELVPESALRHAPGLLPGEIRGHPDPLQYVIVAVVLVAITGLEIAVSYLEGTIPNGLIILLLLVMAFVKFFLVVSWYMHLRTDQPVFRRFFIIGSVAAVLLYTVVLLTLHVSF